MWWLPAMALAAGVGMSSCALGQDEDPPPAGAVQPSPQACEAHDGKWSSWVDWCLAPDSKKNPAFNVARAGGCRNDIRAFLADPLCRRRCRERLARERPDWFAVAQRQPEEEDSPAYPPPDDVRFFVDRPRLPVPPECREWVATRDRPSSKLLRSKGEMQILEMKKR